VTPTRSWSRRSFVRGALGALAAPNLAGCNFTDVPVVDSPRPTSGQARLTARPGSPSLSAPTKGEATRLTLDPLRDGLLYVPEAYAPDTPMPLMVVLHGSGGAATDWESYWARAEAHGMIVLAPESRAYTWDLVIGGFGLDVLFLDAALAHTFDRCNVDPDRIALAGFSDGASYALSLGVVNGDLFSSLIGYSPGFYTPGSPITGAPGIFVSHGTSDQILSFTRTRDVIVPELEAAGYDVTFAPFDGGHGVPAEISEAAIAWFLGE